MKFKDAKVGSYVRFVPDQEDPDSFGWSSNKIWLGEIVEINVCDEVVTVRWQDPEILRNIDAAYGSEYLEPVDKDDIPMYVLANL